MANVPEEPPSSLEQELSKKIEIEASK